MLVSIAYAATKATETTLTSVANGTTHARHGFPPFDHTYFFSQIFWLAISFGLFYLFISRVIVPNMGRVLETRHDRIASDLDNAVRLKSEAEGIKKEYEKELQDARAKFREVLNEATKTTKIKLEQETKENDSIIAQKIAESTEQLNQVKQKALSSVDAMAKDLVPLMLKRLINEDVSIEQIENLLPNKLRAKQ
ncbi:MAG: ATP F0F1 synthase subunit B [Alphaproteobacteria bacterium]|nr:ATP F0F1 synthase subunit B [Alphaproteobacteria bacterium]